MTDERQERAVRRLGGGDDHSLMVLAFESLPERWRTVLWYTDIEHASAAEVASLLGLTSNSISTLKRRATEALRQAYLQAYLAGARQNCTPTARRLVDFVRGTLSTRDTDLVADHIAGCAECRTVHAELSDVHGALRRLSSVFVSHEVIAADAELAIPELSDGPESAWAPVLPSGPALDVDPWPGSSVDAEPADRRTAFMASSAFGADATGGASRFSSDEGASPRSAQSAGIFGGTESSPGPPKRPRRGPEHALRQPPWVPIGVGAVVVAAVTGVLLVALSGNTTPAASHSHRHQGDSSQVLGVGNVVQASPTPTAVNSHSRKPHHKNSSSPSAQPSTVPPTSTAPPIHLAAGISLFGPHGHSSVGTVSFQATDTGSSTANGLVATISLPSGTNMTGSASGDWSCQATASGATCRHAPLSAGQQIQGRITIQVTGTSACGQPVGLTVSTAGASVGAQSAQTIKCPANGGDE